MPPLICPAPMMIDQTFPRSAMELRILMNALVGIVEGIQGDRFTLLLTDPLRSFIRDSEFTFDWSRMQQFPHLQTIYHLLANLGLQPHGVETIDLSAIREYAPHPLPSGTVECLGAITWSEEVGRIYTMHEQHRAPSGKAFIGIGCTSAFSGNCLGSYDNPNSQPTLPLVGPDGVADLDDYETWDVRHELNDRKITFDEALNNIHLLSGSVSRPSGSSHYQVKFRGHRTWTLDSNYRDVPEAHIAELIDITQLNLSVIKYVLSTGKMPRRRKRWSP